MPKSIGELDLPRVCPHFLQIRVAVRPFLSPGQQVVVGLSGGPDSLALTAALLAEGAVVTALCIDHGLQSGSAEIAGTAAAQAEFLGANALVRQVAVAGGSGMEAAAREARYEAFADHTSQVWVAHTMDDQAETFLLGALRGNPVGMLDIAQRGPLQIVRPLLSVRRVDTLGACAELGLRPWFDPHNQDCSFKRVAVRKQLLPVLIDVQGGDVVPALALAAGRAAADAAVLEEIVDKRRGEWSETFPVTLAAEPEALRRRMLADFLRSNQVAVSSRMIAAVDRLLTHWNGQGGVAVGKSGTSRLEVVREDGKLKISGGQD